jgi:hypothetical protein
VVILLAISHELHTMRLNSSYKEALAKFNSGGEASPLPKAFLLKLTTEMNVTPAEFADALTDEI